jgi:hypothetical protein
MAQQEDARQTGHTPERGRDSHWSWKPHAAVVALVLPAPSAGNVTTIAVLRSPRGSLSLRQTASAIRIGCAMAHWTPCADRHRRHNDHLEGQFTLESYSRAPYVFKFAVADTLPGLSLPCARFCRLLGGLPRSALTLYREQHFLLPLHPLLSLLGWGGTSLSLDAAAQGIH